jgi:hypothetical protein
LTPSIDPRVLEQSALSGELRGSAMGTAIDRDGLGNITGSAHLDHVAHHDASGEGPMTETDVSRNQMQAGRSSRGIRAGDTSAVSGVSSRGIRRRRARS